MGKTKNISASNRARLLNLSRQSGQSFQELTQYFAMGRFLYRLAISEASSQFILKGAMLLHARNITHARSTLDIDLLGQIEKSPESIHKTIEQIISQRVDEDGLEFLVDTIAVSDITKEAGYVGRRVNFRVMLESIRIPMQIDIGFGDEVIPEPVLIDTPSFLGYPSAKLRGYAFETSVAEKTHVMLKLELLNSRMKDFYDIWLLSRQGHLNDSLLVDAIVGTFTRRETTISLNSVLFTEEFTNDLDKQKQWAVFCRKRLVNKTPDKFSAIAKEILDFLKPLLEKASEIMRNKTHQE